MTGRVLVVDDISANVKLLEAKLSAEYFDVLSATDGPSALAIAEKEQPDIILLDVMMPGMDGFEVCRRLKRSPQTAHVPVVMVTALDQSADRVQGLEAGADDFLTKPVNDVALFARVKSLVRLKRLTDELRMRQVTSAQMGLVTTPEEVETRDDPPGRILIVDDREQTLARLSETLRTRHEIFVESNIDSALMLARAGSYELVIVSLSLREQDGLRLCSLLRATDHTRNTPILVLVEDSDTKRLVHALEMGVNDYLIRPIDRNELIARVRTQIRRKRYSDRLRQNLELSVEASITDQLTGLYNRRYMASHLGTLLAKTEPGRTLSFLILDIDYFKAINDTYGHDVGDKVLREFSKRIVNNVRNVDLACRYGGEEFVVIMPDTDLSFAYMVAERLRQQVAEVPFHVETAPNGQIELTISIGVTTSQGAQDTPEALLRRADQALYQAKRDGRNRVVLAAAA